MSKIWKIDLVESFSGSEAWCEAEDVVEVIEKFRKSTKRPASDIVGINLVSTSTIIR